MSRSKEVALTREEELAKRLEALGMRATSFAERQQEAENMHYIGFDNATLLSNRGSNTDKRMYTNGIVGCNALVLSGSEGTYMAHIDVSILNRTSANDMSRCTNATINAYEQQIGERPEIAHIITDGSPHEGIINALRQNNLEFDVHRSNQYSIGVGAVNGSIENRRNSNLNLINRDCTDNNLLPAELQWSTMSRELEREAQPAQNRPSAAATRLVDAMRENLQGHSAARETQLYDDGTGNRVPHHMIHTESSIAKRRDYRNPPDRFYAMRENLQGHSAAREPQLYDDGTGNRVPHHMIHTESSIAKRVDKSPPNRSSSLQK